MQPTNLIATLSKISLCQIADACGNSLPLESNIRPFAMSFRICAPALTVLCAPNDNLTLHHALHLAERGQMLAVSTSGPSGCALWGELMSISAVSKGLSGTIIDADARDPVEITALDYPVFARSISPRRAVKETYGEIGQPIRCGSLVIRTGDIVVADCHGIIAIPESQLANVVRDALAVLEKEEAIKAKLRSGLSIFEIGEMSSLVGISRNRGAGSQ
jgi:4-hydroxy-4-methyl-2-oxoglutarate aldolase